MENLLFALGWTKPENDQACREWTRIMAAKCGAELKRTRDLGTDVVTKSGVGEYVNYESKCFDGREDEGVLTECRSWCQR